MLFHQQVLFHHSPNTQYHDVCVRVCVRVCVCVCVCLPLLTLPSIVVDYI